MKIKEGGRHPVLVIEDLISLMLSSGENGAGAVIKAQRVTSKEGWKKQGMCTNPLENIEKIERQASYLAHPPHIFLWLAKAKGEGSLGFCSQCQKQAAG